MDDATNASARVTRALLLAVGLLSLVLALVYNEWTLGLPSGGELTGLMRARIRTTQALFAGAGALLLLAAELSRRAPLRGLAQRPATPLALLTLLGLLTPLLYLDLALRPFIEPKTTLFERDDALGWRLRPGAKAEWGHVRVEINGKGLRGPELPWTKPEAALRVLYLGDSVTFGFGLERHEDTYPYVAAGHLERQLGRPVETLNSGVGGWSPWQEHAYLVREGLRYQPDLVLVGFVLNDVTEKFSLARFGGSDEGWQLARLAQSRLDGWLSKSALASFAREGLAQFRFGRDVFVGAQRYEAEEIRWLAANARDPRLKGAWQITLGNLEKIFRVAERNRIGAALVVFPYDFQVEDPAGTGAPQAMLREFAEARGIPMLDLLPVFASAPAEGGEASAPGRLYLDPSHPSVAGHRVAGEAIADFLVRRELVRPPPERRGRQRR